MKHPIEAILERMEDSDIPDEDFDRLAAMVASWFTAPITGRWTMPVLVAKKEATTNARP